MMRNHFKERAGWIFGLLLLVVLLDQGTKMWAQATLMDSPPKNYMGEFFKLIYAENEGAFLSLGAGWEGIWHVLFIKVLPAVLLVGMLGYLFIVNFLQQWQLIGFSLIVGGGLSNVYDRLFNNGRVIDFMNMGFGDLRTGIFNIADVAIMTGLGFLLLGPYVFKHKSPEGTVEPPTTAEQENA
jgi:signal peptidase II